MLSDDEFQEGVVGVKVRLCQLVDVTLGLHLSEPFPHQCRGDHTFHTWASVTCMPEQVPGTVEPSVSHASALFTSPKAHEVGHRSGGRRSSLPKPMHIVDGTTEARTRGLPPKGCSFCTTPLPRSTAASKLSTWHWCFCSSCSWGHFAHTGLEGQLKNSAESQHP